MEALVIVATEASTTTLVKYRTSKQS